MSGPKKHKLDSLRLLGTVGEPINPEAWMWYRETIGHNRCPIVDTWWQTETGAHHDHAHSRRDRHQARVGDASPFPASCPKSLTWTASRFPTAPADFWS